MSAQERKERERADRERLIVATARELAEQQGWDAVTTRRLAERIEYSQPVLYSHFRGKREIIGAVALIGGWALAALEPYRGLGYRVEALSANDVWAVGTTYPHCRLLAAIAAATGPSQSGSITTVGPAPPHV